MPTPVLRTEHLAQVTTLAHELAEIACEQPSHQVALEALISAYVSVAVCHPCCAQKAADLARKLAGFIETNAPPRSAPHAH